MTLTVPPRFFEDADPIPARPPHLCPSCGYDLRGLLSRVCPECGQPFTLDDARTAAIDAEDAIVPSPSAVSRLSRAAQLSAVGAFIGWWLSRSPVIVPLGLAAWQWTLALATIGAGWGAILWWVRGRIASAIIECLGFSLAGSIVIGRACMSLSFASPPTLAELSKDMAIGAGIGLLMWVGYRLARM